MNVAGAEANVTDADALIAAVVERLRGRDAAERAWVEDWQNAFEEAPAGGDDETTALLLDSLVAFDRWRTQRHPATLRNLRR